MAILAESPVVTTVAEPSRPHTPQPPAQRGAPPPPPAAEAPPYFAAIESVARGSPADEAGLLPRDLVVSFGAARQSDALPAVVKAGVGTPLEVHVLRAEGGGGALVLKTLRLTPHRWDGNGLLGCRMQVIK